MKPRSRRRPGGAEAAPSLQEELVAAIHGAFEVAVEIAVGEVTKLIGRATGDLYEGMRRENESLKQRLQTAEALLDSVTSAEERGGASPPHQRRGGRRSSSPDLKVVSEHSRTGVRGDTPPSGPSDQDGRDAQTADLSGELSHVCLVRVESVNQMCQDLKAQRCNSPPRPSGEGAFTSGGVAVKQEEQDEEGGGPACCLDSVKEEDFSPECMSAAQLKLLEEWKPEELDLQSHDSNTPLSCSRLPQAQSPNLTTNLSLPTDHHASLSSEIFQLAESAPITEAPPHVYGVHVRTSRNLVHSLTNLYTCKSCGQTFHLPSLLRRHHSQCQQRQQQYCQQPIAGSRRTRLQIYPPGCSPFRCTECNREFNRMENLKTHLRIHTGERPYTCSVCSKCFRHSGALTRHFRIHTGEKPYICGQCGKSFRNCGGLKFHQRSHSK